MTESEAKVETDARDKQDIMSIVRRTEAKVDKLLGLWAGSSEKETQ